MSDSLTDETTDVGKPETTSLTNVTDEKILLNTTEEKTSKQSEDGHIAKICEDSSKNQTGTPQDIYDTNESETENTEAKITAEQTTDKEVLICATKQQIGVETVIPEKKSEVEEEPSSTKHKDESQTSEPDSKHVILKEETLAGKEPSTQSTSSEQKSSTSDVQSLKSKEECPAEKLSPPQISEAHTQSCESNETERKISALQTSEPDVQSTQTKKDTSTQNPSNISKSSSVAPSKDEHAEHVTYTEDGSAIYTDPETKYQYKWCTKANNWTPLEAQTTASSSTNPYENEHYKWCHETQKWIPKQAQVTETEHYKWDADKNQWIAKKKVAEQTQPTDIVYDIDEDGQRIYTDKDGAVYFWDVEKNAWFPKIDDDFMARYQMSYGFIDNTSEAENAKEQLELEAAALKEQELQQMIEEAKTNDEASQGAGVKRKAQQEPPKWFEIDPERNTKVYVSNLPLDITLDEFTEVMSKCGMIMRDPQTQKFKLKLYTEADGQVKGDGLCDYIKVESVDLALKILDEYDLRGHKMRVQRAQFQMRGEYNPALKPKRKKKDKEKLAKIKEKLFDWRPEKMRGERSKNEKTVIIKNLFHPELFEKEVQLILDYQNDLREECSKCGTVRKVVIYDRHSEGVAQINMASPEEADLVIQMMQGRFFGKRQLTADHWDGKTKYKIQETEEEIEKRLNKWDTYLEAEENKLEVKSAPDQDESNDHENETMGEKSKVPADDAVA